MSYEIPIPGSESVSGQPSALTPAAFSARRPSLGQQLLQIALICVLATASYYVISHFLVESVRVVGESMHPTLEDTHRYLLNRWVLLLRAPHRGEIV
ncbi:MAG: S26 family signal peptidase, partial [Limisphaerales bacterium]